MSARVPPVLWAVAGATVQHMFRSRPTPRWVRALSLLLLMTSASMGLWAIRGFREQDTTVHPHHIHDVSSLVIHGAHSVSRNPMYMALLGGLISIALRRGRGAALLPVVAVWVALNEFQVKPEELALSAAFSEEFDRYKESVPRWL